MSTEPEDHTSPPVQIAKRNNRFFIDAVIFQVEDELYQVPRSTLSTSSHVFRDMFALPQSGTESMQGLLEQDPIVLPGVKKGVFEDLLTVLQDQAGELQWKLNPKPHSTLWGGGLPAVALRRWTAVLELSRMWGMLEVHTLAHRQITGHFSSVFADLDPRPKLAMARKYALVDLFIIASKEYVMKDRISFTPEEAIGIGLDYALRLVALREERYERRLARALEPPIEPVVGSNAQVVGAGKKSSKKSRAAAAAIDISEVELAVKERFSVEIEELEREYDSFFASTSD